MIRKVLRVIGPPLMLLGSLPASLLAGTVVFVGAAFFISSAPALAAMGALAFLSVCGGLAWLGARGLLPERPLAGRVLAAGVAGGWSIGIGLATATWVFAPMDYAYVAKEPTVDTAYWQLSTGSRLAYVRVPAHGTARATPVIHLHGGPGAPGSVRTSIDSELLSRAGFNVYYYDQVGSGASERLTDVTGYTVARHVADLEAIRQELGADRVILIGGSWGGTLAAHYLAAHPQRVERVVLSSPGPIWAPSFAAVETGSGVNASEILAESMTVRAAAAFALQQINPRAAANLVPDNEMSAFFQRVVGRIIASDVATCASGERPVDPAGPTAIPSGFGYFSNMLTTASMHRTPDPRPALAGLATPALVIRGECDRMLPAVHEEYRDLLRAAELRVLPGVGHAVNRSPLYPPLVKAFVLEQPVPAE